MDAMFKSAVKPKLHKRTAKLIFVSLLVLAFDMKFVLWRSQDTAPSFYIDIKHPVYVDRSSPAPRFPVWRTNGWYAAGGKRVNGNALLSLTKTDSRMHFCNISYELDENATLADFKASVEKAWAVANTVMIVSPSAYNAITPDVMAMVYSAPGREWGCPRPLNRMQTASN